LKRRQNITGIEIEIVFRHFNRTDYFKNFIAMLGIYPAGTLVRLDTAEVALVCRPNYAKPLRPEIRVLFDAAGEKIASPELSSLDEMGDDGRPERSIAGTVSSVYRDIDLSEYLESADTEAP